MYALLPGKTSASSSSFIFFLNFLFFVLAVFHNLCLIDFFFLFLNLRFWRLTLPKLERDGVEGDFSFEDKFHLFARMPVAIFLYFPLVVEEYWTVKEFFFLVISIINSLNANKVFWQFEWHFLTIVVMVLGAELVIVLLLYLLSF